MVFANIEYLFLLLLLIPYIVWYILKRKKTEATLQISDARVYAHTPKSYKNYLLHAPFILRVIALALIIVVLDPSDMKQGSVPSIPVLHVRILQSSILRKAITAAPFPLPRTA